jgi:N6-adenosine-specific RNA methylase IME4
VTDLEPEAFNVTCADPPWDERGGGQIKRGADKHYEVLKPPDILRVMLRAPCWRPAENSVLVMWSTMMSLAKSLWLMDGLGFRYTTHGVWIKTKADLAGGLDIGIGQYFRGAHELFLVGTRGRGFAVKTEDRSIPSVILSPSPREDGKRKHSRKPLPFIEMIERRFVAPYLEMFARKGDRLGWSYWGAEYQCDADVDSGTDDESHEITEES